MMGAPMARSVHGHGKLERPTSMAKASGPKQAHQAEVLTCLSGWQNEHRQTKLKKPYEIRTVHSPSYPAIPILSQKLYSK